MIKLFSLLFEEAPKGRINYTAPQFALIVDLGNNLVILYDTVAFKNNAEYVAGLLETSPSEEGCLNARQVTAVVRNTPYPGAGKIMYQIASQLYNLPITSDRYSGSSDEAQSMWDKIEADPDFHLISVLDNYFKDSTGKRQYVDLSSDTPRLLPNPATPNTEDDCPLPPMGSLEAAIKKLGSDSAYKVSGSPIDIQSLKKRHKEFIKNNPPDTEDKITQDAIDLFEKMWKQ